MMTTTFDSKHEAEVAEIVRKAARIPSHVTIRADSHLVEDLKIDSLDMVAVILQLQDYFDVVIEDDAVPHLCRVADMASYLLERREASQS